jgi:hypothetical protein
VEHVGGNVDGLALDLVGPTAVVSYATNHGTDVSPSHADGLAIVEGLDGGQEIQVLFADLGELDHQDTPLLRSHVFPRALEGFSGGCDGEVDILLGGLGDRADDLLGCGVDDLEGLLVDALYPLIVDEARRC